jgi:8-amino-7-oxononanoate synthase
MEYKNNSIITKSFSSISEIDHLEWDSIVDKNNILNSYGYQKAMEQSNVNNFRYNYLMFYKNNELIAHVSTGILAYDLDMMAGNFFKKISKVVRLIYPKFFKITMIECGHPTALGSSIEVKENKFINEILSLLDDELKKLAVKEKTGFIAIRDYYANQRTETDFLLKKGYRIIQNLPNTFIKIDYNNFEEYLKDLTSKRRSEIKKHIASFKAKNCVIEKITDFSNISKEIESLWIETYKHSKEYQREILNSAYFKYMSENLKEKSFVLLCKYNNRPIGFTMLLDSGESLISTYCGLNYEHNKDSASYFILFYRSIEEAIKMKVKHLELGITNYNPKIELGAIPEPTFIYIKSLNSFFNIIFAPLIKMINPSPNFNKRNIFSKRYFKRHKIHENIFAYHNNSQLQIKDISFNGLGCTSKYKFKKHKTLTLRINIPDDFSIILKAKVKNISKNNNGDYNIGFLIKKIDKEFIPHWYLLLGLNDFSKGDFYES